MADQSDVMNALAALATSVCYPNGGTGTSPLISAEIDIYPGWPVSSDLATALTGGKVHVSIYPRPGTLRNTTRYEPIAETISAPAATLTATVSGGTITWGGTGGAGQTAAVKIGPPGFAMVPYAYRLASTDTPSVVAAAFASSISGASVAGAVLTIPTNETVSTVINADVTTITEYRRQEQHFQMTAWANGPTERDTVFAAIDAQIAQTPWITLADGTSARTHVISEFMTDKAQNSEVYRRDLIVCCEYATTVTLILPRMAIGIEHVVPNHGTTTLTVLS